MSKMMVRKHLLPNMANYNVLEMLRFSLWGPSIFPKEAFENLKLRNPGKTNLEAVLGIKAKFPVDILGTTAGAGSRATEPLTKKQKLNYQVIQTQSPQVKQGGNKRGSRGGKKNNRGKNTPQQSYNKQNGNGKGRSNQPCQNQNRNNNQGKSFQKGKQESNQ